VNAPGEAEGPNGAYFPPVLARLANPTQQIRLGGLLPDALDAPELAGVLAPSK
jgi:hypothetical protein